MTDVSEERLEKLETKLAYLEQANQELSDVLFAQQKALADLAARLNRLAGRIESLEDPGPGYTAADEKPPHY